MQLPQCAPATAGLLDGGCKHGACHAGTCWSPPYDCMAQLPWGLPALTALFCRVRAAIGTQQVCTSVGGQWHSAACKVGAQPLCASAGGTWTPRRMWSLEGGVDLLVVGLLQGCGGYPFFDPCAPVSDRSPQERAGLQNKQC